jgi:PKD repeat protein
MDFRGIALACVVLVALVAGTAPAGTSLVPVRSANPDPFQVSLSATPSFGAAPLSVYFQASVSTGTPTFYHWSFGDGSTLNGSNATYADPEHVFLVAGAYTTEVNVSEGSAYAVASIPLHVVSAPLGVVITARPSSGVEPLTVTFRANVTGGSGTYLSLNWSFGDGSIGSGFEVQYTYERPGDFYVTLRVEDSSKETDVAATWVNLTGPPADGSTPVGTVELWAAIGFAFGAAAVVAVVAARSRWAVRQEARDLAPPDGSAPAAPSSALAPPIAAPADSVPREGPRGPPVAAAPVVRLSHRIVVHLAGQGTLGPSDVAPLGMTQAGMSAALGVRQNGLTNVLRRLVAAGVVTEELRHVSGQPRRLKVYRLTPRGELLARELRHRPAPAKGE